MTQEEIRLAESEARKKHWKRWGPYLSERAWARFAKTTVPTEMPGEPASRSRPFASLSLERRWSGGISDRKQMVCFALALWNESDPILKERIFGLTVTKEIMART